LAWFSYLILSLNKILQIYYPLFALSGLGSEKDVSIMKRGRWNKNVCETLF